MTGRLADAGGGEVCRAPPAERRRLAARGRRAGPRHRGARRSARDGEGGSRWSERRSAIGQARCGVRARAIRRRRAAIRRPISGAPRGNVRRIGTRLRARPVAEAAAREGSRRRVGPDAVDGRPSARVAARPGRACQDGVRSVRGVAASPARGASGRRASRRDAGTERPRSSIGAGSRLSALAARRPTAGRRPSRVVVGEWSGTLAPGRADGTTGAGRSLASSVRSGEHSPCAAAARPCLVRSPHELIRGGASSSRAAASDSVRVEPADRAAVEAERAPAHVAGRVAHDTHAGAH